jgi:hypothetical protein
MSERKKNESDRIALTTAQFEELKRLLESYLKISALGAARELTRREIEKNTWLLHTGGFSQDEIRRILRVSKKTVNQILRGKYIRRKTQEEEEK